MYVCANVLFSKNMLIYTAYTTGGQTIDRVRIQNRPPVIGRNVCMFVHDLSSRPRLLQKPFIVSSFCGGIITAFPNGIWSFIA